MGPKKAKSSASARSSVAPSTRGSVAPSTRGSVAASQRGSVAPKSPSAMETAATGGEEARRESLASSKASPTPKKRGKKKGPGSAGTAAESEDGGGGGSEVTSRATSRDSMPSIEIPLEAQEDIPKSDKRLKKKSPKGQSPPGVLSDKSSEKSNDDSQPKTPPDETMATQAPEAEPSESAWSGEETKTEDVTETQAPAPAPDKKKKGGKSKVEKKSSQEKKEAEAAAAAEKEQEKAREAEKEKEKENDKENERAKEAEKEKENEREKEKEKRKESRAREKNASRIRAKTSNASTVEETNPPSEKKYMPPGSPPDSSFGDAQRTGKEREAKCPSLVGAIVYQIEARYLIYQNTRVCGGVRCILNCAKEEGYVQLISLINEVIVSYDVSTICFLESNSAAGACWCGNPIRSDQEDSSRQQPRPQEPSRKDEPENECEEFERRRRERCEAKSKTASIGMIECAQVIFCTPDQMQRFLTVVETVRCALACPNDKVGMSRGDAPSSYYDNSQLLSQGGQSTYPAVAPSSSCLQPAGTGAPNYLDIPPPTPPHPQQGGPMAPPQNMQQQQQYQQQQQQQQQYYQQRPPSPTQGGMQNPNMRQNMALPIRAQSSSRYDYPTQPVAGGNMGQNKQPTPQTQQQQPYPMQPPPPFQQDGRGVLSQNQSQQWGMAGAQTQPGMYQSSSPPPHMGIGGQAGPMGGQLYDAGGDMDEQYPGAFQGSFSRKSSAKPKKNQCLWDPIKDPCPSAFCETGEKGSLPFDPCPTGPLLPNMPPCLPCDLGDPYSLNKAESRVLFCTTACVKISRNENDPCPLILGGKLKILECAAGLGFTIRLESAEGQLLFGHSLRRNLELEPTDSAEYGYAYETVVCRARKTSMEQVVISFPSEYQMEQFEGAVMNCKRILSMTAMHSLGKSI